MAGELKTMELWWYDKGLRTSYPWLSYTSERWTFSWVKGILAGKNILVLPTPSLWTCSLSAYALMEGRVEITHKITAYLGITGWSNKLMLTINHRFSKTNPPFTFKIRSWEKLPKSKSDKVRKANVLVLKSSKVFTDLFTKPEPKLEDTKLEVSIESQKARAIAS